MFRMLAQMLFQVGQDRFGIVSEPSRVGGASRPDFLHQGVCNCFSHVRTRFPAATTPTAW